MSEILKTHSIDHEIGNALVKVSAKRDFINLSKEKVYQLDSNTSDTVHLTNTLIDEDSDGQINFFDLDYILRPFIPIPVNQEFSETISDQLKPTTPETKQEAASEPIAEKPTEETKNTAASAEPKKKLSPKLKIKHFYPVEPIEKVKISHASENKKNIDVSI